MVKVILVIGNGHNFSIAQSLIDSEIVEVVSGIPDYLSINLDNQKNFYNQNNIPIVEFEDVVNIKADICMMLAYSRFMPKKELDYFKGIKMLHIHGGILPKWRGSNSNAWAIINSEDEVGQTLQGVDLELDGGMVYHIFKRKINNVDKLNNIISDIEVDICKALPQILNDINNKKILGKSIENYNYVYNAKLRAIDGFMKDWNMETKHIFNLYRVIEKPLGPGYLTFKFKDNIYEIIEMTLPNELQNTSYIGHCGAVVYKKDCAIWVKTKDSIIILNKVLLNGQEVNMNCEFKIGSRLY